MAEENPIVPNSLSKLRACMRCHLVKTESQFKNAGCENCTFFKSSGWEINEYTSNNFEGIVSIMNNEESWVSRWLDTDTFLPGCYCLKIYGEFQADVINYLREQNIKYVRNL